MFDLIIDLLHELNISTTNLLYFVFGMIMVGIIEKVFKREDKMLWLYTASNDFYNSIRQFSVIDREILNLFNLILIRSVCILAMDGVFAKKDNNFIRDALNNVNNLSEEQIVLVEKLANDFIERVIAYENEYETSFIGKFSRSFRKRK